MAGARRLRLELARVYDEQPGPRGYRVLVDRLWPRGVSKVRADLDEWLKEVAPSPELRTWFSHDPAKFDEFARRYRAELAAAPAKAEVARLRTRAATRRVTLLTANRDLERSSAGVLYAHLLGRRSPRAT